MLTRIRNALIAQKKSVTVPASNMKYAIARVLRDEGYLNDVAYHEDDRQNRIQLSLKYWRGDQPVIAGLRRISKPGRREYVKADEIPKVLGGLGICILTTPKGILTGQEARRQKVGGEVICEVW
jgi:small subunit ribosomal protein S8